MEEEDNIVELIRTIAENEVKKIHTMELGIITSVFSHQNEEDMDNYECNVKLRDKGVELRKVPIVTQHIGLVNTVHVGDLVLISFINGNINSPVIVGRLYNDEDRPPTSNQEEVIYIPPYSKNNQLRRLNIVLPGGTVNITLNDDKISIIAGHSSMFANSVGKISLKSTDEEEEGKNISELVINESGSMEVFTSSNGNLCNIKMDNNGILLSSDSDINFKSKGNMNFECENGDVTIKSVNVNVDTNISTSLKSGAKLDLKSNGTTSLTSTAAMIIKGLPINLN
jgi:hypothetical protein